MYRKLLQIAFFLCGLLFFFTKDGVAQYKVRGTVYDSTRTFPMEAVTVLSTSGRGAVTNANGEYEIEVTEKDSIWFSYLNKPTVKFPVLKMSNPFSFDISLQVSVPILREVKIKQRDYKLDSIRNRETYARIFNYQKPKLTTVTPQYGGAAGFDLDAIINMFRFKRNRSMLSFQKRLLQQEHEKFVDHRFSRGLVVRLTGLEGDALDSFMVMYRPSYLIALKLGDYDFQKLIKDSYERFKKHLPPLPMLREEDDEDF